MFENQRSDGRAEPSAIGIVCTAFPSGGGTLHRRWRDSSPLLRTVSFAALLSFAAALGLSRWEDVHPVSVSGDKAQAPTRDEVAVAFAESSDRLLDPTPLSEPDAPKFEPAVSGGSNFWLAFIPPAARVETRGLADQARARPVASPTPKSMRSRRPRRCPCRDSATPRSPAPMRSRSTASTCRAGKARSIGVG